MRYCQLILVCFAAGAGLCAGPLCAQIPTDNLKTYARGGMTNTPDIDLLYISREPFRDWWLEANWPATGDVVYFVAHIQNKGGVDTGPFTVKFQTRATNGVVVANSEQWFSVANLASNQTVLLTNTTAFGNGRWQDGDYLIYCLADASNTVNETFFDPGAGRTYTYEHNNDLELLSHALAIGFVVEQPIYDWFGRTMLGVLQNVYYEANGLATNGIAPALPYRGGTYSWEDWAQRHAQQMNEYFSIAENRYFGGRRYALPRVALMDVSAVGSNQMVYGNSPYLWTGGLSAKAYSFDAEWGFPCIIPAGQPHAGEFASAWYTTQDPNNSVIELSLIHELGHHFGRHHCDIAAKSLPPGICNIVPQYNGTVPAFYPGNRSIMPCIEGYGDTAAIRKFGWGQFSVLGFYYQFQMKYQRLVRERLGAQNGGSGRYHADPTAQPHYWNSHTTSYKAYYDGNHFWNWFELATGAVVRLLDRDGAPLQFAALALYQGAPAGPPYTWSIINKSAHIDGQFYAPVSGRYAFSSASLGNVKINVDGENLVRTSDVQSYNITTMAWDSGGGRSDVFRPSKTPSSFIEPGRIFRHGTYRNFKTITQGWHTVVVEYDTHDSGGNSFAIGYECVSTAGVPWQTIPQFYMRWPDASSALSNGLRKGEFSGQPSTVTVQITSLPLLSEKTNQPLSYLSTGQAMYDGVADATGQTDNAGCWRLPISPLTDDPDISRRPALAILRVQYVKVNAQIHEAFLPLDLTDLNMPFWYTRELTNTFTLSRGMDGYAANLPPQMPEPAWLVGPLAWLLGRLLVARSACTGCN